MTSKEVRPYIDFYKEHGISPVSQDISDLKKHYERREYLYRRLGIVSSFIENKSVIEFGPGSGHNALFTYSLKPARYVLVEANPVALRDCENLFHHYHPGQTNFELVESLIDEFQSDEKFDMVISEGLIPAQRDPKRFAREVASFTKPKGICVVTCHDEVGMFADFLRCLIGFMITRDCATLESKKRVLCRAFERHLQQLKGMSRPYEDWVVDQIINTSLWLNDGLFSIADAIDALDASFDVHGVSPLFFADWRWYKDVFGDERAFNRIGRDSFFMNIHNFLDYRCHFLPRSCEENMLLLNRCRSIWGLIKTFSQRPTPQYVDQICHEIENLEKIVRVFSPLTADALLDFRCGLKKYPAIDSNTEWGRFIPWWGRSMQYLSFIRVK